MLSNLNIYHTNQNGMVIHMGKTAEEDQKKIRNFSKETLNSSVTLHVYIISSSGDRGSEKTYTFKPPIKHILTNYSILLVKMV